MCASRRSAFWPRVVAISLIGLGAAGCSSDSGRWGDGFGSNNSSRGDTTGSIPQTSSSHVETRPLPHLAGAEPQGSSGGGQGMASYQPGEVTGSISAPPPPAWTWEGGTPVTVAPGETLETISRRHNVPISAIMQANNITSPAMVHTGDHLVIPRRSSAPVAAYAPPATRIATAPPIMPVGGPRSVLAPASSVHVVAPGETLRSIARL
jgi:LysM repeat protein